MYMYMNHAFNSRIQESPMQVSMYVTFDGKIKYHTPLTYVLTVII